MTAIRSLVNALWRLIKRYPVRAQALIVAAIATGTAFGLGWDGVQVGAVAAFTAALLALVTEQVVTPVAAPTLPLGTPVTVAGTGDQPPPDAAVLLIR